MNQESNQSYRSYFSKSADYWTQSAYGKNSNEYPIGIHRNRILLEEFSKSLRPSSHILDLGCGPGLTSVSLAIEGFKVWGIDQSEEMLILARNNASTQKNPLEIDFQKSEFENLTLSKKFQGISALGFIGYLKNDEHFFKKANSLLEKKGLLTISCRNFWFNFNPESKYYSAESQKPDFQKNLDGISSFREKHKERIAQIKNKLSLPRESINQSRHPDNSNNSEKCSRVTTHVEARQHSPIQITQTARLFGFEEISSIGVHPHALQSIFGELAQTTAEDLLPLEREPASLLWSSVFIKTYRKI